MILHRLGQLEVITGCMFSGKSETLHARLKRAKYYGCTSELFKPQLDTRQEGMGIHDGQPVPAIAIAHSTDLYPARAQVIGIDEANFFDEDLPIVVNKLVALGHRVIVAGLNLDSFGIPFAPIPQLLATADYITTKLAICKCGMPATRTIRLSNEQQQVLVGAENLFKAACRPCWTTNALRSTSPSSP